MRSSALALSLAMVLAACGGSSNSGSGGDSSSGQFTLSYTDAKLEYAIGNLRPALGSVFVDVGVKLVNSGEATPLPTAFSLFSLTSTSALNYAASPATATLTGACTGGVSVAKGGSLSCRIAFEVPIDSTPGSLTYLAPDQRTATASMAGAVLEQPLNTVSGSEGGLSQTIAEALAFVDTNNCPENGNPLSEVVVAFSDIGGYCSRAQGGHSAPNATDLLLYVTANGTTPIAPGTYALGKPDTEYAFAYFQRTDAACDVNGSSGFIAPSNGGSVTLLSITGSAVVGTFEVIFRDGHKMTGTFNAPVCHRASPCSTGTPICGP